MKKYVFVISSLIIISSIVFGQQKYSLIDDKSEVTVEGTSNVHDWEMHVLDMSHALHLELEDGRINNITGASFKMPARQLVSDNSTMDKKAWEALNSKKHENIEFSLDRLSDFSFNEGNFTGTAHGYLTIAGVKNETTIPFRGEFKGKNNVKISGIKEIQLGDFNISPPTAMLGALKTGEKVTVKFKFEFQQESGYAEKMD